MTHDPACCSPTGSEGQQSHERDDQIAGKALLSTVPATTDDDRTTSMVRVEGGTFKMGTDADVGFPKDGEGPARDIFLDPFYVDKHAVSNAHFLRFVRDTGYTTDAERFGWSFVFEDFLAEEDHDHVLQRVTEAEWWLAVEDANWLRPYGPSSSVIDEDLLTHPVTHISWNDAQTYAKWAGKRLPTEAEWEYAARGGLTGKRYPWGDELTPNGEHRCNIWQGKFPEHNTADDGYFRTAPVNEYDPNGYGLHNAAGNVWEWCADWFSPTYHTTNAYDPSNPKGPETGQQRVMRGGSHLCHRSWCNRYRVAARSKNTPNSSTTNIGFRCVVDAPNDD